MMLEPAVEGVEEKRQCDTGQDGEGLLGRFKDGEHRGQMQTALLEKPAENEVFCYVTLCFVFNNGSGSNNCVC